MISMDKKYKTVNGLDARILCVDAPGCYPVRALIRESVLGYSAEGLDNVEPVYSLVEVGPYDDFKIDEPVMVRHNGHTDWARRHFAGVSGKGQPQAWSMGGTSWSSTDEFPIVWDQCRRPTAEELAS